MRATRKKNRQPLQLPSQYEELVRLLPPRAISDEADHDNIQKMIDSMTDLRHPSRGQRAYLETLTILMEAYEADQEKIDETSISPLDVLTELLEQNELSASDLGRLLGNRALGSKILRGERMLSKAHIRTLSQRFKVNPAAFL